MAGTALRALREERAEPIAVAPTHRAAYQAFKILHAGFVVLPILAGLDKFFELLAPWNLYLSPLVSDVVPAGTFMALVGIVEIGVGLLVLARPMIGGYVVAAWLWAIVLNLLTIPGHYDIALRDFGLSLGALALARLSREFD